MSWYSPELKNQHGYTEQAWFQKVLPAANIVSKYLEV